MTSNRNVALLHEANLCLLVRGEHDAVPEFFAPDYIAHIGGRALRGHTGVRRHLAVLRAAFPSLRVDVTILQTGRDRIAWQRTLRGIQKGDCQGFPASGRRVVWHDLLVSRFRGGRIVEDHAVSDLAEQLLRARR